MIMVMRGSVCLSEFHSISKKVLVTLLAHAYIEIRCHCHSVEIMSLHVWVTMHFDGLPWERL